MPRKRYKPEEIVAKLRQVDVLTSQGQSAADAIRSIGVSEVTYYRWRQEFGGLKSDQVKRLKDLETENQPASSRGVGPDAGQADPAGGRPGKLLSPARRRACIEHVRRKLSVSERRACAALGQHRSTQRKVPQGRDDEERLTADIVELARQYGRYGYRKIAALLRRAGWLVNDKRVERIWRREGLKVPTEATEARPAVARRRLLHPAQGRAPQSRLVLRLRRGPHARGAQVPHAQHHRRVHPRMPGHPGIPQAQIHRRHRCALRPVHPAWRSRAHPLRQRARVHRQGRAGLDRSRRRQRPPTSHPAALGRTASSRASCMDGPRGARKKTVSGVGRVRSCIRPVRAAGFMAAGPEGVRGSRPHQRVALERASSSTGWFDPRLRRFAITLSLPSHHLVRPVSPPDQGVTGRKSSPVVIIAQMMRASLLATATATTIGLRRWRSSSIQPAPTLARALG